MDPVFNNEKSSLSLSLAFSLKPNPRAFDIPQRNSSDQTLRKPISLKQPPPPIASSSNNSRLKIWMQML
jgi:hypothetical protein